MAAPGFALLAADLPGARRHRKLDSLVAALLGRRSGVALAAEVRSGNLLTHYRVEEAARALARPGSCLKPFVLKALIDSGSGAPEPAYPCRGRLRIAGRNLDCTHPRVPGPMRAEEALAYSCNEWFAKAALLLGSAGLANALRREGVVGLSGFTRREAAGQLEYVTGDELVLQALGEAEVWVSPAGLLRGYLNLARLRRAGSPRYQSLWRGLRGAVTYGTAQLAQVGRAAVAGKTGTATKKGLPGRHAWFAGYAPEESPEVAVVVFLEEGVGGADAAPIAGAMFRDQFG